MLKRPKPKTLSAEAMQNVLNASREQSESTKTPKSYDPNYPVFEIPTNSKVLIYVPNYTEVAPDGSKMLRMDKCAIHDCKGAHTYAKVRCTQGIVDESLGLDGSCPFCDASQEVWDLYNIEYREIAKKKGVNLDDGDVAKEALKSDRIDLLNKRAVNNARVTYTFPIVVIDCEKDGDEMTTKPKKNEKGEISGRVEWYTISENTYTEKWGKALESVTLEDDSIPETPAGLWFILNYKVPANLQKAPERELKMHSARALNVSVKNMTADYKAWEEYFDKMAESWTPEKAMETVVSNVLRDGEEQKEACDEIMKATRDKLAVFALCNGGQTNSAPAVSANANANAVLDSFGATPAGIGVAESDAELPPQANVNG